LGNGFVHFLDRDGPFTPGPHDSTDGTEVAIKRLEDYLAGRFQDEINPTSGF
jgi:hypothetical protein